MTGDDLLTHAAAVVRDRRRSYGDPPSCSSVSPSAGRRCWAPRSPPPRSALCLIDLKLARLANDPTHLDSLVDIAGYAACLREVTPMSALARIWRSNATPEELEALRQRAWRQQGVLVLWPDEIRDGWVKQALIEEAVRRYGPRQEKRR